jgi:hypothetical protein
MISDSVSLPEIVELYIPHKDETYRAKVQRRTGFELGVAFNVQEYSPSIVPNAPDLAGRVRKPVTRDDGFHFVQPILQSPTWNLTRAGGVDAEGRRGVMG